MQIPAPAITILSNRVDTQDKRSCLGLILMGRMVGPNVVIVTGSATIGRSLRRVLSHLRFKETSIVTELDHAHSEILKLKAKVLIVDGSQYTAKQYRRELEPFLLSVPGWIKTFLINSKHTFKPDQLEELGLHGVFSLPLSHHLMNEIVRAFEKSAASSDAPR